VPDRIVLTANSSATLSSTSEDTRNTIQSAFDRLSENSPDTTRASETGDYITRVGDARVVWRKENDDRILVISVFAPNR
jgi:hypothetical protein